MASKKKRILVALDNGHGGCLNGRYATPGKRWLVGNKWIYEGIWNRRIVRMIAKDLEEMGIDYIIIVPEEKDVSLSERVRRINDIYSGDKSVYGISVHLNAGKGDGWEVWTSKGETESDNIADVFYNAAKKEFPNKKMRSDTTDGDFDKESQFYILKHTHCPMILTENFFMDGSEDGPDLLDNAFVEKIVKMHVNAILDYQYK